MSDSSAPTGFASGPTSSTRRAWSCSAGPSSVPSRIGPRTHRPPAPRPQDRPPPARLSLPPAAQPQGLPRPRRRRGPRLPRPDSPMRSAPPSVTGTRIAGQARSEIDLAGLVRPDGRSQLVDIPVAREVAYRLNQKREPARAVHAGELAGLGLLDALQAALIRAYERQVDPNAFAAAREALDERLGQALDAVLAASVAAFPPDDVQSGQRAAASLLGDRVAREAALR